MARSVESQGHDEGGKRLVPSFHTCLPNSIWARLYPPGSRLAPPDGLGAQDFQGEAWPRWASARRTPLREGARAQVEGPFLAGDGAPSLVWAPAQAAPGTAEPEREGQPERGCSSLCPHEGARAPPGPRCSSEARRGGSGKAPKAQAPGRGRGRMRLEQDAPTAGTPRMCRGFLGTRDCLLRDPSCQAQGGGVPSGFGGEFAAWLGGSGFQETGLKQVLGFGVLGVPSRQAPRHTQPQDWAASWPWSSPPHQGFR